MALQVVTLFDARFLLSGHLARNLPIDMGPSAVLRVLAPSDDLLGRPAETNNVHIVATSRSGPHFAPQLFQAAGLLVNAG